MTTDPQSVPALGNKTLESFKKEAKQWLKALRSGDAEANARFLRAYPRPPTSPGLRDIQHALARELGFASWALLKQHIETRAADSRPVQAPLQVLCEAAGKGDVERIKILLDEHPELIDERIELPGSFGKRTALHYGVDHAPVVKLLLERGADPNIRDDGDNAMPLHFAAEHQDFEVIKLLVEHGADTIGEGTMHELDVLGWATAWHYIQAKPEIVEYLLAHGARYSIFSAVALGAVDAIRRLVARNPDDLNRPMDTANNRRRPLHQAIVKKQPAALEVLLELGADTQARDRNGLTPLDQAAFNGEVEYAQVLIDHGARIELPAAIALQRPADVDRLLAEDPDCLKPGGSWATLIVRAAERAPASVIETLLRFGASPDAADDPATGGASALHMAAFRGNVDAIRVLLAHGANPAKRDAEHGSTPLGWAEYAGQEAAQRALADAPLDIFDAIVMNREARVVEILDTDPAALHRTFGETTGLKFQSSYATPLVWAVGHNKPALVKLLLARGAHAIDAPDGETMLDHALKHGYDEIAEQLRLNGARDA
jgi:ankyrin repeat protein